MISKTYDETKKLKWRTITINLEHSMYNKLIELQKDFNKSNKTDIKFQPYLRKILSEWIESKQT